MGRNLIKGEGFTFAQISDVGTWQRKGIKGLGS
jgi:hypothetical protein